MPEIPSWLAVLIANTAVATLLAALAIATSLLLRRYPQVAHACWWLVLLKLITPPVWHIPATYWPALGRTPSVAAASPGETNRTSVLASSRAAPETQRSTVEDPRTSVTRGSETPPTEPRPASTSPLHWSFVIAGVVLVVASAILVVTARRLSTFARWLERASTHDDRLTDQIRSICARVGLRAPAAVRVVNAPIPPMLWGFVGPATIVFPRRLLEQLAPESVDEVLLHEAAHYHRRDHLLRVVETAIGALLWWHPLAWIARLQIRQTAERCCDAIVVTAVAGRRKAYATTLIDCLSLLDDRSAPVSVGAPRFSSRWLLRKRIESIMTAGVRPHLQKWMTALLLLAATTALALSPANAPALSNIPTVEPEPAASGEIGPTTSQPANTTADRTTAVEEDVRASDEFTPPSSPISDSIPAALGVVRDHAFRTPQETTLTAAALGFPDRLALDALEGCWGARVGQLVQKHDVFVIADGSFERQQLTEIDDVPAFLFMDAGPLEKTGPNLLRITFSNEPFFRSAISNEPPPPPPIGDEPPSQEVLVALDGDQMTMIWVLYDGTEEALVYRRFECP